MEHSKKSIKEFITKVEQPFRIPEFQRPYTWGHLSVSQYLEDIESAIKTGKNHFFGSIVFVRENDSKMVIDGQQRLTTSFLFVAVIYHLLNSKIVKEGRHSAEKIKDTCLYDKYGDKNDNRNIILKTVTNDDKVFADIVRNLGKLTDEQKKNRQCQAFMQMYNHLKSKDNLDDYFDALDRLEIITISLTNSDDNPQKIFESINTTGEPLGSGDKIRNFALMVNDDDLRNYVYDQYWVTLERGLNNSDKKVERSDISIFFRYFLQCKLESFVSDEATYPEFRKIYENIKTKDDADKFYIDTLQYLEAYLFLTRDKVPSSLKTKFDNKRRYQELSYLNQKFIYLGSDIRLSLFMDIFVLLIREEIEIEEVLTVFEMFESYIVRIIVTGATLASLNKNIPLYFKRIKEHVASGKKHSDGFAHILLSITGRNIFRNNENIYQALQNNPIGTYVLRYVYYILTTIEEHQKDIGSLLLQIVGKTAPLSLEHIMPQTKTDEWRKMIGENYDQVHEKYLNNIGNLTLSAYNSKYSNKSFKFKKECDGGFNSSALNINRIVKEADKWTEVEISTRQQELAKLFLKCFPVPSTTIPLVESSVAKLTSIEDDSLTGRVPSNIFVEEEEFTTELPCNGWRGALRAIANYCYEQDSGYFLALCDDDDFAKGKSRLLGRTPDIATYTSNEVVPNLDIYFHNNLSANETFKFIKLLCQKFAIDENVSIEFERD